MAATEVFANNPVTTVSSGGTDAPVSGTSESWTVASATGWPAATTGVTQFHVGDPAVPSEIILVTNVSGTTWTVTRGAESTTPVVHQAGFTITQVVTAGWLGTLTPDPMTALGDMIYGGTSPTAGATTRLAGGTTTAKQFLTQTGTGTASAPPQWGTITAADVPNPLNQNTTGTAGSAATAGTAVAVSGTVSTAHGGTGLGSFTTYTVVTGGTSSTAPLQQVASAGTAGQVLTSNGAGTLPSWQPATGGSFGTGLAGQTLTYGTSGAISWQYAPVDWINVVTAYGADPTGAADSAPAIGSAITTAVAGTGATIYFPAGTYKVASGLTCNTTVPVYFRGAGRWATTLAFSGSGDCLRIYDSSTYSGRTQYGGGVTGLTIDGTSHSGTAASALHMGDIFQYRVDISAENFFKSGDIGVHFDNQSYWTEQLHGRVYTQNCATGVVFDVSGGTTSTNSFARIDLEADIAQTGPSFDGVVLRNGAVLYDGHLSIRGNFSSSSSGSLSSAVLRLTGQTPAGHPAAGGYSLMFSMGLNIQAECGTGATTPHTIIENVPGANFIRGCTGVLDFAGGGETFSQSNLLTGGVLTPGAIWFHGPVYGDGSLNPATTGGNTSTPIMILGPSLHSRGAASYSGGTLNIYTHEGDYFLPAALTQPTTISLNPTGATLGVSQRVTIILTQAASGGPYTVTWPVNASPTTASPTVLWAGGVAPGMSTAASAVDAYVLETVNGSTWFGYAIQAGTAPVNSVTAADTTIAIAGTSAAPAISSPRHATQAAKYGGVSGQPPRESVPFWAATADSSVTAGVMYLTVIPVEPGDVISSVGFVSGVTAASFGTNPNWWTALYAAASGSTATLVAQSGTQGSTAIGSSAAHMLALQSPAPYTVPALTTYVYGAVMINTGAGGTQPSMRGPSVNTATVDASTSLFPASVIYSGTNGTSLGGTAPSGTVTLAASAGLLYLGTS